MNPPKIQIQSVSKRYGNITALQNVDLEINEPQIVGILGPNGAGKSTLLKILTNISKPTSGRAYIGDRVVSDDPMGALSKVGALVEQPEFYPYLRGREVLTFTAVTKGIPRREIDSEIMRVAKLSGCTDFLDRRVGGFSRGMKQRLGLACALLGDPSVLILDEPTFGLDPLGMVEIRRIIHSIGSRKEKIIIMSTHLVHEAQEICDRVIIINSGKVAFDGPIKAGRTMRIEAEYIPDSLGSASLKAGHINVSGNSISVRIRDGYSINDALVEMINSGVHISRVSDGNDLEDLYISVVSGNA
ncbi:ABC transporter ATP-binding protein [Thermoplasmatales archaeon AK]|nr:ABC transporter ATP-binding protein [Thermoplasmatales archaeon AK]